MQNVRSESEGFHLTARRRSLRIVDVGRKNDADHEISILGSPIVDLETRHLVFNSIYSITLDQTISNKPILCTRSVSAMAISGPPQRLTYDSTILTDGTETLRRIKVMILLPYLYSCYDEKYMMMSVQSSFILDEHQSLPGHAEAGLIHRNETVGTISRSRHHPNIEWLTVSRSESLTRNTRAMIVERGYSYSTRTLHVRYPNIEADNVIDVHPCRDRQRRWRRRRRRP